MYFSILKNFFSNNKSWDKWTMFTLIVLFVLVSFFALPEKKFGDYPIFNSPDETANYLFTNRFIDSGNFFYDDIFAVASNGIILPRSMQVVFSRVVPTAFIGQPLIFGTVGKLVGINWVIFFTPIIMGISLVLLYLSLLSNYDRKFAWMCTFLVIVNPAWLYSATRPMMTTGLFISFIILSLSFFLFSVKYQRSIFYALTGVFFGLSLLVRLSEAVWMIPLSLLVLFIYRKRTYWLGLVLSVLCVLPSLALIGNYNYKHFASPWRFGYNSVAVGPSRTFIKTIIFPFGVDLSKSWEHFFDYTFTLFPVWSIISVCALFYLIFHLYKQKKLSNWLYLMVGLLIAGYLIVYYGSWTFFDNPKVGAITIGSSYVRYFLPVYLLSAPIIAFGLVKIKNKNIFTVTSIMVTGLLMIFSFQSVWFGVDEGVVTLKNTLSEYKVVRDKILQETPSSSIIIAGRMDKAVFPFRRVYSGQTDWQVVEKYLFPRVPAYLLSKHLSQEDLAKKREEIYKFNLNILDGTKLSDNFYLYQIIKKP